MGASVPKRTLIRNGKVSEWIKSHKKTAIALGVAGVFIFVGITGAVYHATKGAVDNSGLRTEIEQQDNTIAEQDKTIGGLEDKNSELQKDKTDLQGQNQDLQNQNNNLQDQNNNLQGEKGQLEKDKQNLEDQNKDLQDQNKNLQDQNNDLQGEKGQLEKDKQDLENQNKDLQDQLNAKDQTWEFNPTAEQVKTLKGYMQGKQGKGMQFNSVTREGDKLTMWFDTTISAATPALVSLEMTAPQTPFNTADVMKSLESQAQSKDEAQQPHVHLFTQQVENFVQNDKDIMAGLAGAVDKADAEGAEIWYSFEQTAPDRKGNISVSMYVASQNEDGEYHCTTVDDQTTTDVEQAVMQLMQHYASGQGVDVKEVIADVVSQREAEAE